jgi:hypothetical protein
MESGSGRKAARGNGITSLGTAHVVKALINSGEHWGWQVYLMRNHDLVSDGFLVVTAAGFVLLCSSLLAFAFA